MIAVMYSLSAIGIPPVGLLSPVVHSPDMAQRALSQNATEGTTRITLPLCDVAAIDPNAFQAGDQVVAPA